MDDAAFLRAGESRAPEARAVVERATKKGKTAPKSKSKGSDPYFRYSERFGKDPPPVEPPVTVASPAPSASTVTLSVASQPTALPSSPPALPVASSRPTVAPAPAVSVPTPAGPSSVPTVRVLASSSLPPEPPPIASAPLVPPKPVVPDPKPVAAVAEKVEKADTIDTWEKVAGAKLGEAQATAGKLRATEKGEREVVSALGKRTLVLKKKAFALADPQLTFIADKLATVSVRVGPLTECRSLLSSMTAAWGPATASAELPKEASVWKGDTVGVRVAVDKKDCWVLVVHRPSAKESDWLSLEP